jgi:hypothetical protein
MIPGTDSSLSRIRSANSGKLHAMIQVHFDCPYDGCLTERAAFTATTSFPVKSNPTVCIVPLQCAVCGNGIIAKYQGSNISQWINAGDHKFAAQLVDTWPKRQTASVPHDVPVNTKNYFLQAKGSLQRGYWDAAGTMFRKSIDVSLRTLNSSGTGTIYERIESLPDEAGVTSAMKKWAHTIRRLGADAAHETTPSRRRRPKF